MRFWWLRVTFILTWSFRSFLWFKIVFRSFSFFVEWKAVAVGENYKNAKEFLEKRYNPDLLLEDVIHTALLTLKEGFEGEMTNKNIEIAYVDKNKKFTILKPNEI